MSKLPIDFKIGRVWLGKGTDISVLKQQIEDTVAANEEARYLRHSEFTRFIGILENPIDQLERLMKIRES